MWHEINLDATCLEMTFNGKSVIKVLNEIIGNKKKIFNLMIFDEKLQPCSSL
jgi:hypothetical protein